MKKVNALVEARMGSARLPGKTMMPILGKPSLGLLLERISYAKRLDNIIIATTDRPEDDVIEDFCRSKGCACYRGSSDDVLGRVYNAAKKYSTDVIVEVTGDCIVLDPWLIDECVERFLNADYDYLSNFIEQTYPPGIDVQIFNFKVLEEINRLAKDERFREHVSLYILKHPEKYRLHNIRAPSELCFPDWHIELDERKDYELISRIYEHLYPKNPKFTTRDVIELLKGHPEWLAINRDVKRTWEKIREEDPA